MIGKMMNLKPWAQISKLGKDAEEAGKKSQELAKLARPFIYAQVSGGAFSALWATIEILDITEKLSFPLTTVWEVISEGSHRLQHRQSDRNDILDRFGGRQTWFNCCKPVR